MVTTDETCLLLAPPLRAQDEPSNDSDLKKMMKEAEDMQKGAADIEKEKLQAALKKQLAEPGPVALPHWTPTTPQFKAAGSPTKKIVNDGVEIIVTGTSSLTPEELADAWEAAAAAAKNLNHVRNNISSNGNLTTIMFLSTRTGPEQKWRWPPGARPEKASVRPLTSVRLFLSYPRREC